MRAFRVYKKAHTITFNTELISAFTKQRDLGLDLWPSEKLEQLIVFAMKLYDVLASVL
jgi:hypothetical protein